MSTQPPTIHGTPAVGQALLCQPGTWFRQTSPSFAGVMAGAEGFAICAG